MNDQNYHYYYYYYYRMWQRKRASAAALMLFFELCRRPERKVWMHHYIARRQKQGCHNNLFLELRLENPDKYLKCLRMTPEMYEWLLEKVSPLIRKQDTVMRRSIPPAERLSVTLRHLATGETQESLSMMFRLGQSTISGIIKETCRAIYTVLKDTYLRFPSTEEEWKAIASDFGNRWNFDNCIGAMDGKHFRIDPPINSGSLYFNYKDTYSIVLLAIVDAQLRFIYADVGTNGRIADKGIWNKCSLKRNLELNSLNIPPPAFLPGTVQKFPFIIVGDEGFTLSTNVLIPYSKEMARGRKDRRIFNYRLSRARRCSENAFGILVNRFQIFRSPMRYDPDDASMIVQTTLCLHNLLRTDSVGRLMYSSPDEMDREDILTGQLHPGAWRQDCANGVAPLCNQGGNRHANNAIELRDAWTQYFSGPGAVEWQDRMISVPGARRTPVASKVDEISRKRQRVSRDQNARVTAQDPKLNMTPVVMLQRRSESDQSRTDDRRSPQFEESESLHSSKSKKGSTLSALCDSSDSDTVESSAAVKKQLDKIVKRNKVFFKCLRERQESSTSHKLCFYCGKYLTYASKVAHMKKHFPNVHKNQQIASNLNVLQNNLNLNCSYPVNLSEDQMGDEELMEVVKSSNTILCSQRITP